MAATKLDGPHLPGLLGDTLDWPFFEDRHRRFAAELSAWADATLPGLPHDDVDAACRARVTALGEGGFLRAVVPEAYGGLNPTLDVRTLCLAREILAARDGLADFAFAMQGLGTGAITVAGSEVLKQRVRLHLERSGVRTVASAD